MGKVIYSMSVSLDGYIETPDKKIDWAIIDEEFHTFANQQARDVDIFLYGRHMYELMVSFWPTADQDPSAPGYIVEYARIWKEKPKIVFSKTLEKVEWNSRLVKGNIAKEVSMLKSQTGGDMSIGGAGIAASFMQLGLIDEFQPFIQPVALGGGTPFFPPSDKPLKLRLVGTRTFGSGVVCLRYLRADEA